MAFGVSSERHRDTQSLMLRARFLHLLMRLVQGSTGRLTSGRANHYTTAPLGAQYSSYIPLGGHANVVS